MFKMICYTTTTIYQCYTDGHKMAIIQEHYSMSTEMIVR